MTSSSSSELLEQTEDSLALTFVQRLPNLRYVALWNQWLHWKGTKWESDSTLEAYDLVRKHVRSEVPTEKQFLKATSVSAIEKLARADRRYAATVDQWDAQDELLNTPGGPVSLQSGLMQDPDPSLYMAKSTIVLPMGKAPRWQKFLDEVTGGDVDYQLFLQRVIGYCAGGSTHEHAMFFFYGDGGNGKGIFLNSIAAIMGDYAKQKLHRWRLLQFRKATGIQLTWQCCKTQEWSLLKRLRVVEHGRKAKLNRSRAATR